MQSRWGGIGQRGSEFGKKLKIRSQKAFPFFERGRLKSKFFCFKFAGLCREVFSFMGGAIQKGCGVHGEMFFVRVLSFFPFEHGSDIGLVMVRDFLVGCVGGRKYICKIPNRYRFREKLDIERARKPIHQAGRIIPADDDDGKGGLPAFDPCQHGIRVELGMTNIGDKHRGVPVKQPIHRFVAVFAHFKRDVWSVAFDKKLDQVPHGFFIVQDNDAFGGHWLRQLTGQDYPRRVYLSEVMGIGFPDPLTR